MTNKSMPEFDKDSKYEYKWKLSNKITVFKWKICKGDSPNH